MTQCQIDQTYLLSWKNITLLPITHYNMEMAAITRLVFLQQNPDCVAVELPESLEEKLLQAATRLPDISVIVSESIQSELSYVLSEPCEPTFEALRSGVEGEVASYCIDLDINAYPDIPEKMPDPFSISCIGHKSYVSAALQYHSFPPTQADNMRETHMARRLKELSFQYDKILFVCGIAHLKRILKQLPAQSFQTYKAMPRQAVSLCTLTEKSSREGMNEPGFISTRYERWRKKSQFPIPSRQELLFELYKLSGDYYCKSTGNIFEGYHKRNTLKFVRNLSLLSGNLMPNLFQILTAAKGCVDHNYAYEAWLLSTSYPYLKNTDNLNALELSVEDLWRHSRILRFHLKSKSSKSLTFHKRKDKKQYQFDTLGTFGLCSHQPEDLKVENFGDFLRKKGLQILQEEISRTLPFSTSIEDGIDMRETLRNWHEKKLYVKVAGKPPGVVGSIVIIFDEDNRKKREDGIEKFPWKLTWLGEHEQESDMSFYATPLGKNLVGPGISRCEYGGLMMSYPPRRLREIWHDTDYQSLRNKPEVLLAAAIEYCQGSIVVYVSANPPSSRLKSLARFLQKKVIYIPIGTLSSILINKIRVFHVLDGHDKRNIADEFIF